MAAAGRCCSSLPYTQAARPDRRLPGANRGAGARGAHHEPAQLSPPLSRRASTCRLLAVAAFWSDDPLSLAIAAGALLFLAALLMQKPSSTATSATK